jgi:hypothetical protein
MGKISKKGKHNRKILAEVLENNGFDSKYLLTWGIPYFWDDTYWEYSECVLELISYFESTYKIYDTRDSLG